MSAFTKSARFLVVVTATTGIPAALPASIPCTASSTTTQRLGGSESFSAALRNVSGDGLPFDEVSCRAGQIGTIPAKELLPLAMAHAGKLEKFGA